VTTAQLLPILGFGEWFSVAVYDASG
jgi:hypothetical protein